MEDLNDNSQSAFREILEREEINRYRQNYMDVQHIVSVDLGTLQDYTAICILRSNLNKLEVVHLERVPLHTSYPDIIRKIKSLMNHPKLKGKANLIVDRSGVGIAVVDSFKDQGLQCEAITIIGGGKAHQETDAKGKPTHNYTVPKIDLVSCLQILMENKRLAIAKNLADGETLARELKGFKAKISQSGNVKYEADTSWREEGSDDIVLAVALGCWWSTRRSSPKIPMRMMASISNPRLKV